MPRETKKPGDYPKEYLGEVTKIKGYIGTKSFIITSDETSRKITIYIGGRDKWCITADLIKVDNIVQPIGYLIKLRHDVVCYLDNDFKSGSDTRQLVYFLMKYIYNKYPTVIGLKFNDLSTRKCDNNIDVNLAMMTYLYTGKTWYEKNFSAYVSPDDSYTLQGYIDKFNRSKYIPWDEMSDTIVNNEFSQFTDKELEELYNNTDTWQGFFGTIVKKIGIPNFCNFISLWLDRFILRYFNNLTGINYILPVKDTVVNYSLNSYTGGKKSTRKYTRKHKHK
jgi:hypothetical protein